MNSTQLIELFSSKEIDEKILDIYKDDSLTDINKDRYISTIQRFVSLYQDGDLMLFSAPGRSEVMGNHTDHQHGEVLAAGINLDAIAVVKKRDDNLIKIVSGDYPEMCLDASKENDDMRYDLEAISSSDLVNSKISHPEIIPRAVCLTGEPKVSTK